MLTLSLGASVRGDGRCHRGGGPGYPTGALVIYETTLPVGDTRTRYGPLLEQVSGLGVGAAHARLLLAFSPERVFSGRILADLATYPKLVGGVDAESTARAMAFYPASLALQRSGT